MAKISAAVKKRLLNAVLGLIAGSGVVMMTGAYALGSAIDANARAIEQAQADASLAKSVATTDHEAVIEIRNDVKWITKTMGKKDDESRPQQFDPKVWK